MAAGELTGRDAAKSVYLVASDDPAITEIIDLHRGGETVPYPGAGEIVITEKLAELAGVRVGDTVTVSVSDTDKAELKVAGLAENYVQNYVYMTGETYGAAFSDGFEPKTLLLRTAEGADEYSLSAALSNEDGVASVSVISDTRRMIDNMMQSLNYVVALVLASAGALAFVVLFNLGNINISERVREIATIKVLGFHAGETGAYVFRENVLLSLDGHRRWAAARHSAARFRHGADQGRYGLVQIRDRAGQLPFDRAARPAVHGRDRHHHAPQDRPHRHGRIAEIDRIIQKARAPCRLKWLSRALFCVSRRVGFPIEPPFQEYSSAFFCAAPAPQGKKGRREDEPGAAEHARQIRANKGIRLAPHK